MGGEGLNREGEKEDQGKKIDPDPPGARLCNRDPETHPQRGLRHSGQSQRALSTGRPRCARYSNPKPSPHISLRPSSPHLTVIGLFVHFAETD